MYTYSPFSVRDAVKALSPELVSAIDSHIPYESYEAFEAIYDRWQKIYDTGSQWTKEPIAPSVPLTLQRAPESDPTAQKAIAAECDKELFKLFLFVSLTEFSREMAYAAAQTVYLLGGKEARIHLAGHDISPKEFADAWNKANHKEKRIIIY